MMLRLENVTKRFSSLRGEIVAALDVSLRIEEGEFFVLVGPSGCGKSTLLSLIAGLEKPSGGEIWFGDRLVASGDGKINLSPRERNVAMVFQSYALYPHLTVFENIAFPLRVARLKEDAIKEAVSKAASTMEISDLVASRPAELSGGQRQRVAIARAIVRRPDLFLLDEPLSNLDAQLRATMRVELKSLQRRLGITTVYVTHDQVEAMTLGDRIAVLRNGALEQLGSADELYNRPQTAFVATFIGSPPMNLIKLPFVYEEGVFYLLIGDKKLRVPDRKRGDFEGLKSRVCILGIRPEEIVLDPAQGPQPVEATVVSIEPLGKELLLRVRLQDHRLSVLTARRGFKVNDRVAIGLPLDRAHIFEASD
jgi:multiple sugar transport system ATP-binding protein